MEFLLNFAWIGISLLLLCWQIRAMRATGDGVAWKRLVALGMLLIVLLPVISITDDLMAMTAAADVEHMLRKPLEPMDEAPLLAVIELFATSAMLLFGLKQQRILETISRSDSRLVRLRQGLVRASSVRPPPAAASLSFCA